jgi:Glycine zipper 2TM domain
MKLRRFAFLVPASAALLAWSPCAAAQDTAAGSQAGAPYAHGQWPRPPAAESAGAQAAPHHEAAQQLPHQPQAVDPQARAGWLSECRRRLSSRDSGLGGAAIGGLIGGAAGNRIAGKGHRTVGTLAGAAAGAVAGMAIDRAEDSSRNRDECETYLDEYYAYYARAGQGYGYGHPYQALAAQPGGTACCQGAPMMMVPMMMTPRAQTECTETVEYVDVPVRRRARPAPTKRIRVIPDKRVRIN